MTSAFGILGFCLSLLALFIASEVLRRSTVRQAGLEDTVMKLSARLQKIEGSVYHTEKLAAELRHQRRRQSETITALANKGEGVPPTSARSANPAETFTPSTHQAENAVIKANQREAQRKAAAQKGRPGQRRRSA